MADITGTTGNDTLTGTSGDDTISGLSGDDTINAGDGNDTIDGGEGSDTINGEGGDDTITAGLGDSVDGGAGIDRLFLDLRGAAAGVYVPNAAFQTATGITLFGGTLSNIEAIGTIYLPNFFNRFSMFNPLASYGGIVFGGSQMDFIGGSNSADQLHGGDGDDQIDGRGGDDQLFGDAGNDSLQGGFGHNLIDGGIGEDSTGYSLANRGVTINLAAGTASDGVDIFDTLVSIEHVFGSNFADTIDGDGLDNQLNGFAGDDIINGGGGADQLKGDDGADTLHGGDGNDYLGSGDYYLIASDQSFHDSLFGDGGDDLLEFGAGDNADGGSGNDIAILAYGGLAGGVTINIAAILAGVAGANMGGTVTAIEGVNAVFGSTNDDVIVMGATALVAARTSTGGIYANAGNDLVIGGSANDNLHGGDGDDTLQGGLGDDFLYGDAGADRLYGGAGSDWYYVDGQQDLIFEDADSGADRVVSTGSFYLYANLELLDLSGASDNVFGVGNDLANTIYGNGGDNLLIGGGGDDILSGSGGNDLLFGEAGADEMFGGSGIDYLVGGDGADRLYGGDSADALYGGAGDDSLDGGDSFDTDILVGGDGDDQLDGNSGQANADYDLMDGGAGNDTYYVDTGDDLTFEAVDGGFDWVYADVKVPNGGVYLWANVEALTLVGTTAFGVGNELDNVLVGNASGNWLLGGDGNDRLLGRGGNDVLFGQAGADTFAFRNGDGQDVIGDFSVAEDRIELTTNFTTFAQLQAAFHQNGSDGAIDLGGGNFIVLQGVTMSTLTASNFVLLSAAEEGGETKIRPVMEAPGTDPALFEFEAFADSGLQRWGSPLHDAGWLL